MMTQADQAAMYNELITVLDINAKPDGSGNDVIIPIAIYWGYEPVKQDLPCIIISFTSFNIPKERSLSDINSQNEDNQFEIGFQGIDKLKVKVKAVDYKSGSNTLSKSTIAQEIMKNVYNMIFSNWNKVLTDSSIAEDYAPIDNVSAILEENEIPYELQTVISFTNFVGGVPTENGIILNNTAPLVEYIVINMGISPVNNTIAIEVGS